MGSVVIAAGVVVVGGAVVVGTRGFGVVCVAIGSRSTRLDMNSC